MPQSGPRCLVLAYHEIAPMQPNSRRSLLVSPRTFASHLAALKVVGGQSISLDHLSAALRGDQLLPKRSFVITFDDAYTGVYRYAVPLLRRFRYSATVFVPSARIGQRASGNDIRPVDKMDLGQLQEIIKSGISIGAHTRTHPDLRSLDDAARRDEVETCRSDLESLLGHPVRTFAYPFGRFDRASVEAVRDAGYLMACTTRFGVVRQRHDPFLVPRVLIGDNLFLPMFLYRCWRATQSSAETGVL